MNEGRAPQSRRSPPRVVQPPPPRVRGLTQRVSSRGSGTRSQMCVQNPPRYESATAIAPSDRDLPADTPGGVVRLVFGWLPEHEAATEARTTRRGELSVPRSHRGRTRVQDAAIRGYQRRATASALEGTAGLPATWAPYSFRVSPSQGREPNAPSGGLQSPPRAAHTAARVEFSTVGEHSRMFPEVVFEFAASF